MNTLTTNKEHASFSQYFQNNGEILNLSTTEVAQLLKHYQREWVKCQCSQNTRSERQQQIRKQIVILRDQLAVDRYAA